MPFRDPTARTVVVGCGDGMKSFRKFSLLLLALPYPTLALSSLAAARVIDRVSIDPIRVAPNAVSGLDIAGGLPEGCIEFSEFEEKFISIGASCSWFL